MTDEKPGALREKTTEAAEKVGETASQVEKEHDKGWRRCGERGAFPLSAWHWLWWSCYDRVQTRSKTERIGKRAGRFARNGFHLLGLFASRVR